MRRVLTAGVGLRAVSGRLAGDTLTRLRLVADHARVALPASGRFLEQRRQARLARALGQKYMCCIIYTKY